MDLCDDVCLFVKDSFYVDDGLISRPSEKSEVNIVQQTQERLKKEGNLLFKQHENAYKFSPRGLS